MMMKHFTKYLDKHDYPKVLFRFPFLVRMTYFVNYILTLRNWYVYRALRKAEKELSGNFTFLDAGSGMGEFSLGVAKRHPNSSVIGIDFTESNAPLATCVANSINLHNIEFRHGDLTRLDEIQKYDLILCNSTLQFIKADEKALQNIGDALKSKGKLVLYVPVRYKRYFPWSEIIERKYLADFFYKYHDNFLMHRYSAAEIINKIQNQGFKISSSEYAYGAYGAIAFELYSMVLAVAKRSPIIISVPSAFLYACIILPVQLLLMIIDFILPHSTGNGMLIVAEKYVND